MMRYNDSPLSGRVSYCIEDIHLGFAEQINRILRKKPLAGRFLDDHKVVHVLSSVLHFEKVLPLEIGPECCADEDDVVDLNGFVFQKMDVLGERQLVLQFMNPPEEVIMVKEVISLDVDNGQKLLGKDT